MSSSYYAEAPHAGASWRSHRDGDQPPESFPHDDIPAVASKSTKTGVRSGHDEHSVPVSPPSSGIERERGDEDRRSPPAGKQAAMSGNVELPGDRANGNFPRESSGSRSDDNGESQAISAVALLLLAASATSQSRAPIGAARGGVSANGSPVADISSPSSADAASAVSPDTVQEHPARARQYTSEEFATTTPAVLNSREAWPASSQPVFRPDPGFTDDVPYGVASGRTTARGCSGGEWVDGNRSSDGGGNSGGWVSGTGTGASRQEDRQALRAPTCFSSLAQLSASGSIPPSISVVDDGRARNRYPPPSDGLPASAAPVQVVGPQPFSPRNYAPSMSSKIDHNRESWSDGRDGRYETLSLQPSAPTGGGRFFPGGNVHMYGNGGGEAGGGTGRDSEQLPRPRRPSPCSTNGGPLRIQPTCRHDEAKMAAPASLSMRAGGGGRHMTSTAVSPRGRRSPSPPRSAGRRKPVGYRSPTGEGGVGRGWNAMAPGGSGSRGGRTRRWTPHIARSVVGGQSGTKNFIGGIGRADAGEYSDAIIQQQHHQGHQHYKQQQQQQQQTGEMPNHFYKQQQHGETEQGQSDWSRKRSRIVAERKVEVKEEEEGKEAVRQKLSPSSARGATGQVHWRNGRAANRAAAAAAAAAAVVGSSHPQPSKRHRSGVAEKAPTNGSLELGKSRRPRAMDLDTVAPGESSGIATAATNKGAAAYPGRPSPRKKSKNLVWSQFRKACDRCTDKKVRCDGSNPTGGFKACTPCKKAGVSCLFGICRRSGPRDAHGHKTAAAGVIMKRNDFEKVTERLGQCRTPSCRFVNEDGSFWREHFHCRVGDCSFAGKNMSELLLHRGKDHPELPEVVKSSAMAAAEATAAAPDESLPSDLVREIAAPCEGGIVC